MKGMSLIEVIVSMVLMSTLLGVVLGLLTTGLRESTSARSNLEIQADAHTGLRAIVAQLAETDIHSVLLNAPAGAGGEPPFISIDYLNGLGENEEIVYDYVNPSTYGRILWQEHRFVYYKKKDRTVRVHRKQMTPSATPAPYRDNLTAISATDQVLARNVDLFAIYSADTVSPSAPTVNPLTVWLECTAVGQGHSGYPGYRVALKTDVVAQNSSQTLTCPSPYPTGLPCPTPP
ncbi:MAG TPA: prepilin-type N-terminal cleavage/methylation domain-containing protein [Candidatus Xenobia bacterium]